MSQRQLDTTEPQMTAPPRVRPKLGDDQRTQSSASDRAAQQPSSALRQMQRQYGNRAVQRMVARAQQGEGPSEVAPAVAQGIQHARGGGRPLDAHLRAQFEPAFGHDFQHVRVHTDSHADTLSRALHARAFATGRDLFFRHGEYNPGSSAGRELLAHELTHVVQQHGVAPSAALTLSQPGDGSEREAEHVARAVMQREQHWSQPRADTAKPHRGSATVQRAPTAEREWATENPAGGVQQLAPDRFVFWNFDIGSAELKPEHLAALNELAREWQILSLSSLTKILVDGHASRSGGATLNLDLSTERARSVERYLVRRGVDVDAIEAHGYSAPLAPNLTGHARALNRRVEVRVIRPTPGPPPKRPTMEPPEPKQEFDIWKVERQGPLSERVPSTYFEGKLPLTFKPMPVGQYLLMYPSAEIIFKLEFLGETPTNIGLAFKDGKFQTVLKQKLNDMLELKGDTEGKVSATFYNVPLKPEGELNLRDPLKPASFILTSPSIPIPEVQLPEGMRVKLDVQIKAKFAFGLSPAGAARLGASALARMAPGAAAIGAAGTAALGIGGVLVGGAAVLIGVPYMAQQASEEGLEHKLRVAYRDSFAWRIAAEATGDSYSYRIALEGAQEWRRAGLEFDVAIRDAWSVAERAINAIPEPQRAAFFERLKQKHGYDLITIRRSIFYAVGGYQDAGFQPPTSLDGLL